MTTIKKPFFIVNPKSYLYGNDVIKLAKITDELAKKFELDCLFTSQLIDIPSIKKETSNLIITAQHMDSLYPGRGMGKVLPEALQANGVQAVVLNHAENPLSVSILDKSIRRAKELGILSIVCSDTSAQCSAIAELHPDMMICEPTSSIGTGNISNDAYITETTNAVHSINNNILIMQAAGVSTGKDVTKVLELGADGTGGTSGIIKSQNWAKKLTEMMSSMVKYREKM